MISKTAKPPTIGTVVITAPISIVKFKKGRIAIAAQAKK
jgi:hypothetical protein